MEKTADRRYFYTIVSSSTLHKDSIKYLKQIRDLYGPYLHQEKSIKTKAQNSVESFFPSELSNFEKTISSCNSQKGCFGSTRKNNSNCFKQFII